MNGVVFRFIEYLVIHTNEQSSKRLPMVRVKRAARITANVETTACSLPFGISGSYMSQNFESLFVRSNGNISWSVQHFKCRVALKLGPPASSCWRCYNMMGRQDSHGTNVLYSCKLHSWRHGFMCFDRHSSKIGAAEPPFQLVKALEFSEGDEASAEQAVIILFSPFPRNKRKARDDKDEEAPLLMVLDSWRNAGDAFKHSFKVSYRIRCVCAWWFQRTTTGHNKQNYRAMGQYCVAYLM